MHFVCASSAGAEPELTHFLANGAGLGLAGAGADASGNAASVDAVEPFSPLQGYRAVHFRM